ncbi:MAG TPA: hypothetical protein PLF40_02510 [Kofleriaceae bacterium]|jgi:predicted nucleotidyltransferase|nr:hypothetical protein [Kofleriaceae bacterium]
MSSDEIFLVQLARAISTAQLEVIVVGSMAAAIQGAPIMTQDIDLLIRDTPRNRTKLAAVAKQIGAAAPQSISELSRVVSILGGASPVDVLFDEISGGLTFASLRSRAVDVSIAGEHMLVASLDDIIASKTAAGRPKDNAQLPILRLLQQDRNSGR